jgi:hypothetical protein
VAEGEVIVYNADQGQGDHLGVVIRLGFTGHSDDSLVGLAAYLGKVLEFLSRAEQTGMRPWYGMPGSGGWACQREEGAYCHGNDRMPWVVISWLRNGTVLHNLPALRYCCRSSGPCTPAQVNLVGMISSFEGKENSRSRGFFLDIMVK